MMIHLHKQLWCVVALHRSVDDSDYKLAYMTHREYNKDNTEAEKFTKRKYTGESWAKGYERGSNVKTKQLEFDNSSLSGFSIVGSKSRWSTQNKVIQAEDPRGFVVEIPVSALTTLLKHTTVTDGVVKEHCLWGREGNNHILIPVNSDIYQQAAQDTYEHNNKAKFNQLSEGDKIKFSVDDTTEYVYAGKYKAYWNVKLYSATTKQDRYWDNRWTHNPGVDTLIKSEIVPDNGYKHLFIRVGDKSKWQNSVEYKGTGSCVLISKGGKVPAVPDDAHAYCTNKVQEYFGEEFNCYRGSQQYTYVEFLKFEKKEK